MLPRIKTVKPTEGFKLRVTFDDGREVLYDVSDDIKTIESFCVLQTVPGLFEQVKLDESRTCVYWNDRIDLASDTIYEFGRPMKEGDLMRKSLPKIEEMERLSAEDLSDHLDEIVTRANKEDLAFVVTVDGEDDVVLCPARRLDDLR